MGDAVGRGAARGLPSAPWTRCARSLIVRPSRILLLLTPPFDKSDQDPGYIKGYPPGIRENGGQYTHAAVWALMAIAKQGNGDEATELFHMLNPINHTRTPADVQRYRTEPYVLDGDVYARPPHAGPRRLELVHRIGGLAVSRRPREHPRPAPPRRHVHDRSVRAVVVGSIFDDRLEASTRPATRSASTIPIGVWTGVLQRRARRRRRSITARFRCVNDGKTHVVKITMGRTVVSRKFQKS